MGHSVIRVARALALLVGVGFADTASAHDDWESLGLAYNPAQPGRYVLESNRGALVSDDGGATWRLLCRTLVREADQLSVGVTARGATLWGRYEGLLESDARGCGLRFVNTPMNRAWPAELHRDPTRSGGWLAGTAYNGMLNGIYRSDDDGRTWRLLGEPILSASYKQIRTSSDGARLYAGEAQYLEASGYPSYFLSHSDDDGVHWTRHAFTLRNDQRDFELLDVDPMNAQRVFASIRACRMNEGCLDPEAGVQKDKVLVSDDAGASWSTLIEVTELGGFAIDDRHIWVADWTGGIWRMNRSGGDRTFLEGTRKPGCLVARAGELLVCGELKGDHFLLARSTDDGVTFHPIATADNIEGGPLCEPGVSDAGVARDAGLDFDAGVDLDETSMCRAEWRDLCFTDRAFQGAVTPPLECGSSTADAGIDAGMDAGLPPSRGPDGCDCTVAGASSLARAPMGWCAFGLAWCAARIARRRRSR